MSRKTTGAEVDITISLPRGSTLCAWMLLCKTETKLLRSPKSDDDQSWIPPAKFENKNILIFPSSSLHSILLGFSKWQFLPPKKGYLVIFFLSVYIKYIFKEETVTPFWDLHVCVCSGKGNGGFIKIVGSSLFQWHVDLLFF